MLKRLLNWFKNNHGIYAEEGIPIERIVNVIKRVMVKTEEELSGSLISIKEIELTLKTVSAGDASAKAQLQIPVLGELKLGSGISEKSIQTIQLSLKLSDIDETDKELIKLEGMEKQLNESIKGIIDGVKAAKENKPFLMMNDAFTELNFTLASESEFSLIIESGFKSELSNNLKITFENVN